MRLSASPADARRKKKPAVSGGVALGSQSPKAHARFTQARASIADADAPGAEVSVAVFKLLPLDMAVAVDRLIALFIVTRAVIAAVNLRADDRAGGETADDTGCDRAVTTTRKSRLRRGRDHQCQCGNGAQ